MGWVIVILVVVAILVIGVRLNKKDRDKVLAKYDFTPEQKELFLSKKLWVGMPIDALYAIKGEGEQNKTQTSGGEHIQHVYKYETDYHYVYTDNGIVTSWQSGKSE
jgi:hypothetical protein